MRRLLLGALALLVVAGLVSLGVWQLERRVGKLNLIAQVDRRLAAAPIASPGPKAWPHIGKDDAYTRIVLHGTLLNDRSTLVQAATDFGAGYWVMTPLATDRGFTVLLNRGFVLPENKGQAAVGPSGPVTITGLLRISEPKGGFLRTNDPAADRWYSRDVAAIATKRKLGRVAPYFVDADARSEPGWPRGGLTVIAFPNNHLQYALTWFTMAAVLAFMSLRVALRRSGD